MQYIRFRKTSGSNVGPQTCFLPRAPSNLVTPLPMLETFCIKARCYTKWRKPNVSKRMILCKACCSCLTVSRMFFRALKLLLGDSVMRHSRVFGLLVFIKRKIGSCQEITRRLMSSPLFRTAGLYCQGVFFSWLKNYCHPGSFFKKCSLMPWKTKSALCSKCILGEFKLESRIK